MGQRNTRVMRTLWKAEQRRSKGRDNQKVPMHFNAATNAPLVRIREELAYPHSPILWIGVHRLCNFLQLSWSEGGLTPPTR
jgi:hypothetical protein